MDNRNIFTSKGKVTDDERHQLLKQKGFVVWLIGRSGSGKSTIGIELEKLLTERGYLVYRIDGDNMRQGLCSDLRFSRNDRMENIRRIAEVAKLLCKFGIIVIVCTISPAMAMRNQAKLIVGEDNYNEIYIKASYNCCAKRDTKGLYMKANLGEIDDFLNINFEEPESLNCIINTENEDVQASVQKVVNYLVDMLKLY